VLLFIPEFIGRFHPLLVHLPIGILLLAPLLQWLSRREGYTLAAGVLNVVWLLGIGSALLSCITGYLLSLSGEYDKGTVNLHMWAGIGVTLVAMFAAVKVFNKQFDNIYKATAIGLLLLITFTGHLGGSLTHGGDYLFAGLGDGNNRTDEKPVLIADVQAADVYADVVSPMLKSRCYSCHGPQKQKGGLRMDSPEGLMKGGKEAKAFIPGKPDESEMIKRLLLPPSHEDHMPPKEKPQLSEAQIALIHWWIEQGAPFNKKVQTLTQPEKIKTYLQALQGATTEEKKLPSNVPAAEVAPAAEKDIAALAAKGVLVMPVAQDVHYLSANFVNAGGFSDQDAALLLPLKQQLVWLKMGNTGVGDSTLQVIGQCPNLTVLQLNNTSVTDKGLAFLQPLSALQSLNLVGTAVSAAGLEQLKGLQQLQSVYLYRTKVTAQDWPQLKKIFPQAAIDSGGYVVKTLATDTVEKK
jgi:Predicted membrane protein